MNAIVDNCEERCHSIKEQPTYASFPIHKYKSTKHKHTQPQEPEIRLWFRCLERHKYR